MVVRGGHHINVELGQYSEWPANCRHEMTFEVETYLSRRGSAVITQIKLYVLELDDDDSHNKATGS